MRAYTTVGGRSTKAYADYAEDEYRMLSGPQLTCFTSTKVQILTHLRRQACAAVLSLRALLVPRYKYGHLRRCADSIDAGDEYDKSLS
jgi:hypothetical protein